MTQPHEITEDLSSFLLVPTSIERQQRQKTVQTAPYFVGARTCRDRIHRDSRADQWEHCSNGIAQEEYLGSNAPLVAKE